MQHHTYHWIRHPISQHQKSSSHSCFGTIIVVSVHSSASNICHEHVSKIRQDIHPYFTTRHLVELSKGSQPKWRNICSVCVVLCKNQRCSCSDVESDGVERCLRVERSYSPQLGDTGASMDFTEKAANQWLSVVCSPLHSEPLPFLPSLHARALYHHAPRHPPSKHILSEFRTPNFTTNVCVQFC